MKHIVLIGQSVVLYGVVGLLLRWSTTKWRSLPVLDVFWWILLPGILVIKDIFLFVQGGRIEAVEIEQVERTAISKATDRGRLPQWYVLTLVVRKYLFPLFLTAYLVYLLVEQTQIWELHTSLLFLWTSKTFLLVMTIVLWVVMLFGEKNDTQYTHKKDSILLWWGYVLMTICLSGIGWYIVLQQVLELKIVGMVIANIVIVLLYLVGVLLLEEEDIDNNNEKSAMHR